MAPPVSPGVGRVADPPPLGPLLGTVELEPPLDGDGEGIWLPPDGPDEPGLPPDGEGDGGDGIPV